MLRLVCEQLTVRKSIEMATKLKNPSRFLLNMDFSPEKSCTQSPIDKPEKIFKTKTLNIQCGQGFRGEYSLKWLG
ncbi:hypothetical protein EBR78_02770 [bacterium]|nr:hypothetical protein [bacterium]